MSEISANLRSITLSTQLEDYALAIAAHAPHLRELKLVQVANWWDKVDCRQLAPLAALHTLTHLWLQEPGRRWGGGGARKKVESRLGGYCPLYRIICAIMYAIELRQCAAAVHRLFAQRRKATHWKSMSFAQLNCTFIAIPILVSPTQIHTCIALPSRSCRWGVRVLNLPTLSSFPSLSLLVTGIECTPGGASRLVLHGMTEPQRGAVLRWAQGLQDRQAGACP